MTYVEWGGRAVQVVPWMLIDGRLAAENFAAALASRPLQRISFTSISNALLFGRRLVARNAFHGVRRVIDISGDGPNNGGAPVPLARNAVVADGIIIDGLPILLNDPPDASAIADLDLYYEHCVIGGPGAFMMTVTDIAEFGTAIQRKLALEITGPKLTWSPLGLKSVAPAQFAGAPGVNCLIGEERLERDVR